MAGEEDDPAALEDAVVLLTYATTAAGFGQTSITPGELEGWLTSIRTRVITGLAGDPPPTRDGRLLQVRGQLGLVPNPAMLPRADPPRDLPEVASLVSEDGTLRAVSASPLAAASRRLTDPDVAMNAWAELARRLPETPLFRVVGTFQVRHRQLLLELTAVGRKTQRPLAVKWIAGRRHDRDLAGRARSRERRRGEGVPPSQGGQLTDPIASATRSEPAHRSPSRR